VRRDFVSEFGSNHDQNEIRLQILSNKLQASFGKRTPFCG